MSEKIINFNSKIKHPVLIVQMHINPLQRITWERSKIHYKPDSLYPETFRKEKKLNLVSKFVITGNIRLIRILYNGLTAYGSRLLSTFSVSFISAGPFLLSSVINN